MGYGRTFFFFISYVLFVQLIDNKFCDVVYFSMNNTIDHISELSFFLFSSFIVQEREMKNSLRKVHRHFIVLRTTEPVHLVGWSNNNFLNTLTKWTTLI